MKIGNFDLNKDILVIAEIGNNHEGNIALAEEMIGLAAKAGAGAVKFQTIIPEALFSIKNQERITQMKKFQLSYEEFEKLAKVAKKEGIMFLSTPFDIKSASFLNNIVPAFKIASGDNNFYPLIDYVAGTGKPIIISSGFADFGHMKSVKERILKIWNTKNISQELAILHCVPNYPTLPGDVNLMTIKQLQRLNVTVGYSDHAIGIESAVLSAALGARIIEKHFTIDKRHSDFRDHQLSADPKDLKELVERVKNIVLIPGDADIPQMTINKESEICIRRSIVAGRDLEKGIALSMDDLSWVRPAGGLSPGCESQILGKVLKHSVQMGEILTEEDVCK